MPDYVLPYGRGTVELRLPEGLQTEFLLPTQTPAAPDGIAAVEEALTAPLDSPSPAALRRVRTVAIAINDKSRPVPHHLILPPLLAWLEAQGVDASAITLIIATGTHIPMTESNFPAVVPPAILERYAVISHDCDAPDLVNLGTTPRGTPILLNRRFMEADLRIVVGNIEPHHFAGFSGGVKSAAIGLGGRATIETNHALLRDPLSALARYEDNPLRQDIEDIGARADIAFALNVVMNDHKEIVRAFAGSPQAVMQAGIPWVRRIYEVPVAEPFDLVITCPGGYPKDINLYQAHKAVSCANRVTREGGTIVLVAACEDGVGNDGYETWMGQGFASHHAVLDQLSREPFRIGPHKALLFSRDAIRVRDIWVVSDIAPDRVRRLLLKPAESLHTALNAVLPQLPTGARVGILPYANATIPFQTPKGEL